MAYDEGLAQRVREMLEEEPGYNEKKMFGGICFLLHGNMSCGIIGEELIVRVGPVAYQESLQRPNVREFDFTGRPMKGWVTVACEGHEADEDLNAWLDKGMEYALSLPGK